MSWEVAEAATYECLDAYLQAIQRGDHVAAEFWRRNTLERIVNLNDAIRNHIESGRADGAE